ncbi:MAG: DUF559 domain-containing protein [Candidatus Methanosuratincola petrocarbonis]
MRKWKAKEEENPNLASEWRILEKAFHLPPGIPEYKFALDKGRLFRFDFAWPEKKVAVELEGGTWIGGRHVRPEGFERDLEKYNLATALGWRVFRFSSDMLKKDPESCASLVARALSTVARNPG